MKFPKTLPYNHYTQDHVGIAFLMGWIAGVVLGATIGVYVL